MTTPPPDRRRALAPSLVASALALAAALAPGLAPAQDARAATPAVAAPPAVSTAASGSLHYDQGSALFHPVHGAHAMVVCDSPLAAQAGLQVLRDGGNAVDAAVAMGFALAVTLPNAGNLGGGGFLVMHDGRTGRDLALDFRETAPAAATRDLFLDAQGRVVPDKSLYTHAAIGVPGTVAGLLHALERYGTRPRAVVMAPAIELAARGWRIDANIGAQLRAERDHLGAWPATRRIFLHDDGTPRTEGELLVQEDLARSLRRIADLGVPGFYEGPVAQAIAAEMRAHGGLVTEADLKAYRAVERAPVRGRYRGYEIVAMPPPSSGGVHLVQMLNLLQRWPLRDWGPLSTRTVHVMAESMKLAYADRSEYLGDPDFLHVPVNGLVSPAYADELARGIDLARARPSSAIRPGRPQPHESDQTTQYTVADAQGTMVSVTYTLNLNFGSGIVAPGTGILLNNEMDDFSAKPGVPNAFGLVGGDANAVGARKRPLSSMTPTIVLKDGRAWLATGAPGGSRIITTVLEAIVDAIDFDMNPAEAAATARFHHQWLPDELRVERGFPRDTADRLRAMGHAVVERPPMGRTQTIQAAPGGGWVGASDPRNPSGTALGD